MTITTFAKKAVLVGVCTEPNKGFGDVPGALEDVTNLRELLISTYKYHPNDITVLLDKDPYTEHKPFKADNSPTTKNILQAMRTLVSGRHSGDHIVFAFSGHGSQTDHTNDKNEKDNKDEFLIPSDYVSGDNSGRGSEHPHLILDDEIRKIFVDQLPEGVHCTLIFDCCHSGTVGDLPEVELAGKPNGKSGEAKDMGPRIQMRARGFTLDKSLNHKHAANAIEKGPGTGVVSRAEVRRTSKKEVTSWSACMDAQQSFGGKKGGQFMNELIRILKGPNGKTITNRELLSGVRVNLQDIFKTANEKRRPGNHIEIQEPQLGSLRPDSILDEVFTL